MFAIINRVLTFSLAILIAISSSGLRITEHVCSHCGNSLQIFSEHKCEKEIIPQKSCCKHKQASIQIHKPKCCISKTISFKTSQFFTSEKINITDISLSIPSQMNIPFYSFENFETSKLVQNNSPPKQPNFGFHLPSCCFLI